MTTGYNGVDVYRFGYLTSWLVASAFSARQLLVALCCRHTQMEDGRLHKAGPRATAKFLHMGSHGLATETCGPCNFAELFIFESKINILGQLNIGRTRCEHDTLGFRPPKFLESSFFCTSKQAFCAPHFCTSFLYLQTCYNNL